MNNPAKHSTSLFLEVHMPYIFKPLPSSIHRMYQEISKYIKSITSMVSTAKMHLITIIVSNTIFHTIRKSTITLP